VRTVPCERVIFLSVAYCTLITEHFLHEFSDESVKRWSVDCVVVVMNPDWVTEAQTQLVSICCGLLWIYVQQIHNSPQQIYKATTNWKLCKIHNKSNNWSLSLWLYYSVQLKTSWAGLTSWLNLPHLPMSWCLSMKHSSTESHRHCDIDCWSSTFHSQLIWLQDIKAGTSRSQLLSKLWHRR